MRVLDTFRVSTAGQAKTPAGSKATACGHAATTFASALVGLVGPFLSRVSTSGGGCEAIGPPWAHAGECRVRHHTPRPFASLESLVCEKAAGKAFVP